MEVSGLHATGEWPVLDEETRVVYRFLAEVPDGVSTHEVRARTRLSAESLDRAVGKLMALRLLCASSWEKGTLRAVPPDCARVQLVWPIVRELNRRQREMDAVREVYSELAQVYENATLHGARTSPLEVVRDLPSVRQTLTRLAAEATEEVITSQPGGARPAEALEESLARTDELLDRGVRLRTLYQHTARFSPVTTEFVQHVSQRGAEVRTQGDGFMKLLLFDGKVAVTALRDDRCGALVVRDPHVVDVMRTVFERAWTTAVPFRPRYDPVTVDQALDDIKTTIAHLLTEGLEDKVIARRLGMSLRTCQRHISDIMRRLGARNRLHLGYLLHSHRVPERAMVGRRVPRS
ncbi:regulatory protein, luxR family [Streptomyces sp. yr375]|uniref:helix-turn-helix domain-containing protein n=1 Tax=Streptomyces sp. yr375 TaxID=1761906 RepID=UPI0008B7FBFD|nr:helix-turn-helix transcriptional regulator [Streptomyces sp. yr375]SEP97414.1 regulatory protein, luxR family [Streptomyces sp. yr375]